MIIEVCSQNRALKEVTNIQTGELVSVISIVSSDEKDVKFDCKENLCGVLHLKFNDLEKEYDEEGIPYGRPLPKSKDLNGLKELVYILACKELGITPGNQPVPTVR